MGGREDGVVDGDVEERRRWMRNAANATSEMMVQPPTVPPTMGPRLCLREVLGGEVGVGLGVKLAVTVTTSALGGAVLEP